MSLLLAIVGARLASAASPAITSPTNVDIFYDAANPGAAQFSYRIVATGSPTAFDATGLPPDSFFDGSTGWINGSRNVPGVYNVAVRAMNSDGTATATVRLAIHPAATGVTSSRGVFQAGQTIAFTVRYNTAVVVTGSPRLALAIGPDGAQKFKDAVYASGSGTNEIVFQYAVVSGDVDPDGVQLLPSMPEGGALSDASGLAASTTLPVKYFVSGITIAPSVAVSSGPSGAVTASRLANVSSRMRVVSGDSSRSLIAGFVVAGAAPKRVLLRAIGPALTGFGVQGALADPRLQLYASSGALVTDNDNWSGAETSSAATAVGAFSLSDGARDSAAVVTLQPGAYTLVVMPNGGDGVALAEVYDADPAATTDSSGIINLSSRGQVDGEDNTLVAGFAVKGTAPRRVLIRGIGPALGSFGVAGALSDPTLKIYQNGQLVGQNDDWTSAGAEVTTAATASGAFALAPGSKDSAIVLTLAPGAYSAVVSGAGNSSGAGLVEVYELPAGV